MRHNNRYAKRNCRLVFQFKVSCCALHTHNVVPNMKMDKELEQEINSVLTECQENGWVTWNNGTPEIRNKAIRHAKTLELIQTKGRHSFELTSLGLKAVELNGVKEYLNDLESKDNKDDLIKTLTIKQLKGNIFQVRYWWLILLLSGIIGFITGNFVLILKWFE